MAQLRESIWTQPRDDCEHPEWWHSPDWDTTEDEVSELVAAFVRALQPEAVVETGSAFGFTSERIGRALKKNRHGMLWTFETDQTRARMTRERCRGLPVTVVGESSLDHTQDFGPFDFGFLDSLVEYRLEEFSRFRWNPGAIVGFHDTGPHHGWGHNVRALGNPNIYLRTPRGVTFVEVT